MSASQLAGGGVLVLTGAVMGCIYSRWRQCSDGERATLGLEAMVDEDDYGERRGERCASPHVAQGSSSEDVLEICEQRVKKKKRVEFCKQLEAEMLVPMLCDIPLWTREEMYWGAEDYAMIRDNQRRLIEMVLRQAREYPDERTPPPIPGESRRGLGICCEPGTNSGRASRVRSARRAVIEAQRDGYTEQKLSDLAVELSRWATRNAYDVGLKDHEAIADFDYHSFATRRSGDDRRKLFPKNIKPPEAPPFLRKQVSLAASPPPGNGVARAMRTETKPAVEAAPEPARGLATDGLGLASMIRNDSLNNLSTLAEQDSPRPPNDEPTAAATRDGLGLASMIRNDSLGNLAAMGCA